MIKGLGLKLWKVLKFGGRRKEKRESLDGENCLGKGWAGKGGEKGH